MIAFHLFFDGSQKKIEDKFDLTNNVLEPFQNFLRIAKPSRTDISFPITNISDESNYDLEKNDLEVEKNSTFKNR